MQNINPLDPNAGSDRPTHRQTHGNFIHFAVLVSGFDAGRVEKSVTHLFV